MYLTRISPFYSNQMNITLLFSLFCWRLRPQFQHYNLSMTIPAVAITNRGPLRRKLIYILSVFLSLIIVFLLVRSQVRSQTNSTHEEEIITKTQRACLQTYNEQSMFFLSSVNQAESFFDDSKMTMINGKCSTKGEIYITWCYVMFCNVMLCHVTWCNVMRWWCISLTLRIQFVSQTILINFFPIALWLIWSAP